MSSLESNKSAYVNKEKVPNQNILFERNHVDALVMVSPPSPSNTNPQLSTAVLEQESNNNKYDNRFRMDVADWNIGYIQQHGIVSERRNTQAVGDQGKDRKFVASAVEHFLDHTGLRGQKTLYLPDSADSAAGMHHDFATVQLAIAEAKKAPFWSDWLEREIFSQVENPPSVVGASVMGPSQVFAALLLFETVKERWPDTATVMGGSHTTILIDEIKKDKRYTHNKKGTRIIDAILPGHSEKVFHSLVHEVVGLKEVLGPDAGIADMWNPLPHISNISLGHTFDYYPLFSKQQLNRYDKEHVTLPLQFTRGCIYNECTFCTYPVVEPIPTAREEFDPALAQATIAKLVDEHDIRRFSIKDSLFSLYWMTALAEQLLEKGPENIQWSATTKVVPALKQRAPMLAASGLSTIELGIETIHKKGLELFHKYQPRPDKIEDIVLTCAQEGITVVVNLIFGLPGETPEEAQKQLEWFLKMQNEAREKKYKGRVEGSFNLLEITRGSPLETKHPTDVKLEGVAPWASVYKWNAPSWRKEFAQVLADAQLVEA